MSNLKEGLETKLTSATVFVTVPVSLLYNYEKMQSITKNVLNKLGCAGCHSGFDLRFNHENEFIFNERGELAQ
jgi:hypothetical protein